MIHLDPIARVSHPGTSKTPTVPSLEGDSSSDSLLKEMKAQIEWILDCVALLKEGEITLEANTILLQEIELTASYQAILAYGFSSKFIEQLSAHFSPKKLLSAT